MDLTPFGVMSTVLMDGDDISTQLRGIVVRSDVGTPTTVELIPAKGARVSLIARLPEAQIVIGEEPKTDDEQN